MVHNFAQERGLRALRRSHVFTDWLPRLPAIVAVLAALLALVWAPGAEAARKVPARFVGTSYDGPIRQAPDWLQALQFPKMAAAGAEALRVAFKWAEIQPHKADPIDLG